MTNEELCILAKEGNANAEEELIRKFIYSHSIVETGVDFHVLVIGSQLLP